MIELGIDFSNSKIISSSTLRPDIVGSLLSNKFSLILPYSCYLADDIHSSLVIQNKDLQHALLLSPAIGSSKQSPYECSKVLEEICCKWFSNDPNLLIILDSSVLSILTYHFQPPYSYTLLFKNGTNDYSFEYIEFVINKLKKLGYSFLSLNKINDFSDLNCAINRSEDICLYAFNSFPLSEEKFLNFHQTLGAFLLNRLGHSSS